MNNSDVHSAIQSYLCRFHARRVIGIESQSPNSIFDVLPKDFFVEKDLSADYLQPNVSNYEVYYGIAKHYKPTTLLEIGVRFGYSFASMIKGAEDSIELAHGFDNNEYEENSLAVAWARLGGVIPESVDFQLFNINSQCISNLDRSYDLISIDGDHWYDSKLHDLTLTLDKCKVVVVDDYMEEIAHAGGMPLIEHGGAYQGFQPLFPIKAAVDEFVRRHKDKIKDHFLVESLRGIYIIEYKE